MNRKNWDWDLAKRELRKAQEKPLTEEEIDYIVKKVCRTSPKKPKMHN